MRNKRKGKANKFEFVDGYMKTELGSLTSIKTGKLDANASSENGIYPFFTCAVEPLKIDSYSYDCECVLVAGNGDLNVKYYNGKFDAYQRTYIIESKDKSKLTVPYLYYFLESYIETLRSQSIGGIIKYIKLGNLTNAPVPVLSIEKQNKIVKTLDKAKSIITHLHTQLEKLDLLVKARFVEMFGDPVSNPHNWEKKSLSELAEIKIGPFGSLLHKEDYIENAHALVNPSHISEGKIVVDLNLTVSDEKYNELSAYHLFVDDVVMGRRGEMGRCAVVTENGLLCGTGSMIIRTNGILKADFIQKIISFPSFKKTIEDMAVGQTMPNINVPIVSNFMIICPPLEVQEQYYSFAEQTDKSKVVLQKELEKVQMLFDSLIQEYFG